MAGQLLWSAVVLIRYSGTPRSSRFSGQVGIQPSQAQAGPSFVPGQNLLGIAIQGAGLGVERALPQSGGPAKGLGHPPILPNIDPVINVSGLPGDRSGVAITSGA